jgi:hypothetical protein
LLDQLARDGARLAELHRELLPFGDPEGFVARLEPYRSTVAAGADAAFEAEVLNPFDDARRVTVQLVVPDGWRAAGTASVDVAPGARERVRLVARAGAAAVRARVAVDVTVGDVAFGQQAEALVDVS